MKKEDSSSVTEESGNTKDFMKSMQEWWDSDACKEMQKAHQEAIQRAVGKYFMLSGEDKMDMVQAICYIMCKAEKEGTSHRGLQDELGIYPEGFWIDGLMEVHNALWSYYHEENSKKELDRDIEQLRNITQKENKD